MKKVLTVTLIIFILSITSLPSYALGAWSGKSWSGETWKGNKWTQDPFNGAKWQGTEFQQNGWNGAAWEGVDFNGAAWAGTSFDGQSFSGSTFQGNSFQGSTHQGNAFHGSGFQGSTHQGNAFQGNGFQGSTHQGSAFQGSGYQGSTHQGSSFQGGSFQGGPYQGNFFNGNAYQGKGFQGNPYLSNPFLGNLYHGNGYNVKSDKPVNPSDKKSNSPDAFEITKFAVNDLMAKNIDTYSKMALENGTMTDLTTGKASQILAGFKMASKGNDPLEAVGDLGDAGFSTYDTINALNEFKALRLASTTQAAGEVLGGAGSAANAIANSAPAISTLAKVNAVTGVVGLGLSSVELYKNWNKALSTKGSERTDNIIESVGSVGSILMSGGAISMAVPGGQALGLGLMAVGGGISIATAGVKFFRRKSVRKTIGKAWNGVKSFGSGLLKFGG